MNGVWTCTRPGRSILMNSLLPEGRATKIASDNKKKLSLEYGIRSPVMQGFQSDCHFIRLFKGILKNRKEINTFVDCSRSHLWGSSQMGLKMDSVKLLFLSQCYLEQIMALIHLFCVKQCNSLSKFSTQLDKTVLFISGYFPIWTKRNGTSHQFVWVRTEGIKTSVQLWNITRYCSSPCSIIEIIADDMLTHRYPDISTLVLVSLTLPCHSSRDEQNGNTKIRRF